MAVVLKETAFSVLCFQTLNRLGLERHEMSIVRMGSISTLGPIVLHQNSFPALQPAKPFSAARRDRSVHYSQSKRHVRDRRYSLPNWAPTLRIGQIAVTTTFGAVYHAAQ